ncbi:MAG TPA: hypothetical protein VF791_11515 [Pyrinomonadaceae bacterium]
MKLNIASSQSDHALSSVNGSSARTERERRFLLSEMPEGLTRAGEHIQIWDNYITNTRLRLRKIRVPKTKEYILRLTQKFAPSVSDPALTTVTSIQLSPAEYNVLAIFEGNEIRKNRYPFEYEGRTYSIDVFLGALWGLILAETDFETDEELRAFKPPPFASLEITGEELFTGGRLVELTADEIQSELLRRAKIRESDE